MRTCGRATFFYRTTTDSDDRGETLQETTSASTALPFPEETTDYYE